MPNNLSNIAVVDSPERERILSIISDLIASEINILVISSTETADLYRQLHDRYSGRYSDQFDDFQFQSHQIGQLEIISGNHLASILFNKKISSIDLADLLCGTIESPSNPSFLIIEDMYAVGNEYLKSCISIISRNSARDKIYFGLVFDSLDRALENTKKYCPKAELIF